MYISLISAHSLGLSGMHFFTCIKVQWNGKAVNRDEYLSQKGKRRMSDESEIQMFIQEGDLDCSQQTFTFTRPTICGLFAPWRGRGLSLWLYSVETVIIPAIHHGRNKHYFCFILVVEIPQTSSALVFRFIASPAGSHSSVTSSE